MIEIFTYSEITHINLYTSHVESAVGWRWFAVWYEAIKFLFIEKPLYRVQR